MRREVLTEDAFLNRENWKPGIAARPRRPLAGKFLFKRACDALFLP